MRRCESLPTGSNVSCQRGGMAYGSIARVRSILNLWFGFGRLCRESGLVIRKREHSAGMSAELPNRVAGLADRASGTENSGSTGGCILRGIYKRDWSLSGRRAFQTATGGLLASGEKSGLEPGVSAGQRRRRATICMSAGRKCVSGWGSYLPRPLVFAAVLWLSACAETQEAVDNVARQSAKAAVEKTLVTRFPGVPKAAVTPFTDCIIDNATGREIAEFAKDAVVGVSETTVSLVQGVLARPETQTCVARAGLAALAA